MRRAGSSRSSSGTTRLCPAATLTLYGRGEGDLRRLLGSRRGVDPGRRCGDGGGGAAPPAPIWRRPPAAPPSGPSIATPPAPLAAARRHGGDGAGIGRRQDAAAGFDRHRLARHVIAFVERLAERHRVARQQGQLDTSLPGPAAEILQHRPALQPGGLGVADRPAGSAGTTPSTAASRRHSRPAPCASRCRAHASVSCAPAGGAVGGDALTARC